MQNDYVHTTAIETFTLMSMFGNGIVSTQTLNCALVTILYEVAHDTCLKTGSKDDHPFHKPQQRVYR